MRMKRAHDPDCCLGEVGRIGQRQRHHAEQQKQRSFEFEFRERYAALEKGVHRQPQQHEADGGVKAGQRDADGGLLDESPGDVDGCRGDDGRDDDPRKQAVQNQEGRSTNTGEDGNDKPFGREDDSCDQRDLNGEKQGKPLAIQLVRRGRSEDCHSLFIVPPAVRVGNTSPFSRHQQLRPRQ